MSTQILTSSGLFGLDTTTIREIHCLGPSAGSVMSASSNSWIFSSTLFPTWNGTAIKLWYRFDRPVDVWILPNKVSFTSYHCICGALENSSSICWTGVLMMGHVKLVCATLIRRTFVRFSNPVLTWWTLCHMEGFLRWSVVTGHSAIKFSDQV